MGLIGNRKIFVLLLCLGCFFYPLNSLAQTDSEIGSCQRGLGTNFIINRDVGIRDRIFQLRTSALPVINNALTEGAQKARLAATKAAEVDAAINSNNSGSTGRARQLYEEAVVLLRDGYKAYNQASIKYDETYQTIFDYCAYGTDGLIVGLDTAASNALFSEAATFSVSIFNLRSRLDQAASTLPHRPFGLFEVLLPGITERTIDLFDSNSNRKPILRYVGIVINLIIAGIVAIGLISIVVAGYLYVTAGGDAQKVTTAKSLIGAALLGIVLALGAFLLLNTIGSQFASDLREPGLTP